MTDLFYRLREHSRLRKALDKAGEVISSWAWHVRVNEVNQSTKYLTEIAWEQERKIFNNVEL